MHRASALPPRPRESLTNGPVQKQSRKHFTTTSLCSTFVLMPDTAVARTELELRMVEALVDCAHALSMAVADAAEAEADSKRRLQLFEAFQHGFLAVRMGIRLSMMLRAAPRADARPAADAEAPERGREHRRRLDGGQAHVNHARLVRITAEQHRSRGIGRQLVQRHPGEVERVGAPGRGGDGLGHRVPSGTT